MFEATVKLFLSLQDGVNTTGAIRKADVSLTLVRRINEFEQMGLIETKRTKYERIIFLTKKGRKVQKELWEIK